MKFTVTTTEVPEFKLLPHGSESRFEIVGWGTGLQTSGKTNGCTYIEVKLKFYADAEFKQPVAQWTERITMPDAGIGKDLAEFLEGICNSFVKCIGLGAVGEEVELGDNIIGYRGWAKIKHEGRSADLVKSFQAKQITQEDAYWNRVAVWLPKEKITPRVIENPVEPF